MKKIDGMRGRTQWHNAFVGAMQIGCRHQLDSIEMIREYQLTKKPLMIDLLIIKKAPDVDIDYPICRGFRKHNVIEYKSPGSRLSIDDFYKVLAYCALYKADGRRTNEISNDEITMTFVREERPRKLMKHLERLGAEFAQSSPGVYNAIGAPFPFPITIAVYKEIGIESAGFLGALTREMDMSMARELAEVYKREADYDDKFITEAIDSVMTVVCKENETILNKMQGGDDMFSFTHDIVLPKMRAMAAELAAEMAEEKAKEMADAMAKDMADAMAKDMAEKMAREIADEEAARARADGIISTARDFGASESDIISRLVRSLKCTKDEAELLLKEA